MRKEELADLIGEFTWNFGQHFFIETDKGNFIWSDPDYNGTGEIEKYDGSYESWIGFTKLGRRNLGRSKGSHRIGNYCGDFIWSAEE